MVQYRDKRGSVRALYKTACVLRILTAEAGAIFIINDRTDLALAAEADGVHLGQDDLPLRIARKLLGPHRIIGISTHNVLEARDADSGGADYVAFGAVYKTLSKPTRSPKGPGPIREIAAAVSIPVYGIGGIRPETAVDVIAAGGHGVAVISAILSSPDIAETVQSFHSVLERPGPPS